MDNIVQIQEGSEKPKYQQIIASIQQAVQSNLLKKGDKIPSLNQLMKQFNLSQDTVITAYNELKARGLISSAVGKGYYVASSAAHIRHRIFVLFDKLTAYKEVLHEAMQDHLGIKGSMDIYFHYANPKVYQNLIEQAIGNYTSYIIMPLEQKSSMKWLKAIPQKQLYLLDRGKTLNNHGYSGVFQNFHQDTLMALNQGLPLLKKYKCIKIISNDHRVHLQEIISGCRLFCDQNQFQFQHYKTLSQNYNIETGDVFLVINDKDLVSLVHEIDQMKLKIGEQVGLISYNDAPLKQIAAGGITTISTDFSQMGINIIDMIFSRQRNAIDNPAKLIIRNSV
ncbi:MAG: GntR family transcriptional regulator [Cyclobacteriaceae bacterium]